MGALRAARGDPPDTSPTHFADGRTERLDKLHRRRDRGREREGTIRTKSVKEVQRQSILLLQLETFKRHATRLVQKCAGADEADFLGFFVVTTEKTTLST